jgi:hypothetical protein
MTARLQAAAGILLLALSLAGAVHGARAALAQAIYFDARYGASKTFPDGILRRYRQAHALYPSNYRFSAWAGETAAAEIRAGDGGWAVATARRCCDAGLDANPFHGPLRLLRARLLDRESPIEAVRYWERYVDWQYWSPQNHAVLVDLCARAGDFEKAARSLALIRNTRWHEAASQRLRAAWAREMKPPVPPP